MEQEKRETRAPDGRRLVFHVAGPETAPLLVFHTGTPGAPHLYAGMVRECTARGMRIACIARPGYDGSDRLRGRTYADNPADTAVVADALGAERFSLHGHSGGVGPALADAARLGERVRAVTLSAGLAPRDASGLDWWAGLAAANGEELKAIQAGEPALRRLLEGLAEEMRKVETGEDITSSPDFGKYYGPADRACFTNEFLDWLVTIYRLVGRDSLDGWIDDDFAFFGEWGFDLAEVAVPVTIWQGGEDKIIPVAHAEWLAENVPGARLELHPEDGHVSLLNRHFGAMLDDLIARGS